VSQDLRERQLERANPHYWLAAFAFIAMDSFVTAQVPYVSGMHWNWSGKVVSTFLSAIIIVILGLTTEEVGLSLPCQSGRKVALRLGIITIFVVTLLNYFFRDHQRFTIEGFSYQLTMPGLAEELAFRGVAYALVARAVKGLSGKTSLVPTLVVAIAFAATHAFTRTEGKVSFLAIPFVFSLAFGIVLGEVRRISGSVWVCVIIHNLANVCGLWAGSQP
jgi:membrane protease YdiL (CAAX protease family)